MSKKLTRELIAQKAKSDRIQNIKNLNLWGSNLDDISIIKDMPSLEIVSLSVNKIRTLKPFANLNNLKELYLRNNLIADLREIQYLTKCENLKILWLSENPISNNKNYRALVIQMLPQLAKLDDIMITEAERENACNDEDYEEDDNNDNNYENEEDNKFNKSIGTKVNRYQDIAQSNDREDEYIPPQENINRNKYSYQKYQEEENDYTPPRKAPTYNYNNKNDYRNLKQSYTGKSRHNEDEYEEEDYNDNDEDLYYQQPKQKVRRIQTAQVRGYNNDYSPMQNKGGFNKLKRSTGGNNYGKGKDSNILNCVLMLLDELSHSELRIVQKEIEKKERDFY